MVVVVVVVVVVKGGGGGGVRIGEGRCDPVYNGSDAVILRLYITRLYCG